jgi:hypothetical protein
MVRGRLGSFHVVSTAERPLLKTSDARHWTRPLTSLDSHGDCGDMALSTVGRRGFSAAVFKGRLRQAPPWEEGSCTADRVAVSECVAVFAHATRRRKPDGHGFPIVTVTVRELLSQM